MTIEVVAIMPLKPEMRERAIGLIRETLPESHGEPGVVRLAFNTGECDPDLLVAVESYADEAAIAAHRATPHLGRIVAALPEILGGKLETYRLRAHDFGTRAQGSIVPDVPGGRAPTRLVAVAVFRVKPGKRDTMLAALEEETAPTHAEPGVHRFAVHTDRNDPDRFVVVEAYAAPEVLEAHLRTPHIELIRALLPDVLDGPMRVIRLVPLEAGGSPKGLL